MDNKLKGIVKAVSEKNTSLLLQFPDNSELWWKAIGNAANMINTQLKGDEVEITIVNQESRTFSYISISNNNQPSRVCVSRDRIIVRQNAMTQASSFIKLALDIGLLKGKSMPDLEEMFFDFSETCEEWVFRQ